jgi:hypothetical protein
MLINEILFLVLIGIIDLKKRKCFFGSTITDAREHRELYRSPERSKNIGSWGEITEENHRIRPFRNR